MSAPVRIQLKRTKGWRLQQASRAINGLAAITVTRPGRWGNPFTIAAAIESEYAHEANAQEFVVECFHDWIGPSQSGRDWWQGPESDRRRKAILDGLAEIRGKNLACWCPLNAPCHADVLLALANEPLP